MCPRPCQHRWQEQADVPGLVQAFLEVAREPGYGQACLLTGLRGAVGKRCCCVWYAGVQCGFALCHSELATTHSELGPPAFASSVLVVCRPHFTQCGLHTSSECFCVSTPVDMCRLPFCERGTLNACWWQHLQSLQGQHGWPVGGQQPGHRACRP